MSLLNRVICGDSCMATITVADTSGKTLIIIWYDHKIYKNSNLRKEVGIMIKVREQVVNSNQLEIAM